MHRALLVSELLSLVFVHVEQHDLRTLDPGSRGTLARCARVCKAWHEPATRLLWHTQDSLLPLMRLFPRDAFSNSSRKDPGLWRFKRTLRPVDWEAFTRYAPLVRSLSFREGKDVLPSSVVALDMQRPACYRIAPLLPNLTTLKWTVSLSNTLTLCIPLASPSLRSLLIHVVGAEAPAAERNDAAGGLLCTLVDIAPQLTEIHLNIDKLWTVGDVVNPLMALPQLRVLKLDVGSIGPFILRGLCPHRSLSRLEIDLCGIDESFLGHLSEHRPRPDEFPSLRELSITADMHIVNTTLSMLLRAPLASLAISTFCLIHPTSLHSCLSTLLETSPYLRELRIATSFPGGDIKSFESTTRLEDAHVGLASLFPMMGLKHLQIVSFHLFYPVRLDDVDVAMLVGALPALTEFTMNPAPEWAPVGWKPAATMQSLRWLAANATGIQSFGLAIDYGVALVESTEELMHPRERETGRREEVPTVSPPTPPLTPEASVVMGGYISSVPLKSMIPRLEVLSLGASFLPAGMEDPVATSLVTLFPRLQLLRPSDALCEINGSREGGEFMKERWDRVEQAVRMRRGPSGAALAGQTTTRRKRTQHVFEMMDADVEMEICGEEKDPSKLEDDDYEWGLASDPYLPTMK